MIDADRLIAEWYAVKDDEDLRKTSSFLWQHPQDMIETIEYMNLALKQYVEDYNQVKKTLEQREVVLKYYDSIIDDQQTAITHLHEDLKLMIEDRKELMKLISPEVMNTGVNEEYSGA